MLRKQKTFSTNFYFCDMNLEKYIAALLYRYQCVIVPGFGAFITENIPATYNEQTRMFSAPKKSVQFQSKLTINDGVLAGHLAKEEQISYEEAVLKIRQIVAQWLTTLEKNQSLSMPSIGTLQMDAQGFLNFQAVSSANYLTSSFGLSSVLPSIIMREGETEVAKEIIAKKTSRPYLKIASAIVLALGLSTMVSQYYNYQEIQDRTLAVEQSVQDKVHQKLQQATFAIEMPRVLVSDSKKVVDKKYHIIAGAFRTERRAKILTESLQKKGYVNAKYLDKSKHNMRQVVYNSYKTAEEAQRDLRVIHQKVNPEAWVYVQE